MTSAQTVLNAIAIAGKNAMTRNEIVMGTSLTINNVCGRVAELQQRGQIIEAGKRRCRVTGNVNQSFVTV